LGCSSSARGKREFFKGEKRGERRGGKEGRKEGRREREGKRRERIQMIPKHTTSIIWY